MDIELQISHREIMEIFEKIGRDSNGGGWTAVARAPDVSPVNIECDDLWFTIKEAMKDVGQKGKQAVDGWVELTETKINALRQKLGESADRVIEEIQKRLDRALEEMHAALLRLLPARVMVQGATAQLNEVSIRYQVSVGAEVRSKLHFALQISAGSTLSVSGKYTLGVSSGPS